MVSKRNLIICSVVVLVVLLVAVEYWESTKYYRNKETNVEVFDFNYGHAGRHDVDVITVVGSHNEITLYGKVSAITVTGNYNTIKYPARSGALVKDYGTGNRIIPY